jgi:hypothetical protein
MKIRHRIALAGTAWFFVASVGAFGQVKAKPPQKSRACEDARITWNPSAINLVLPPGGSWSTDLTLSTSCPLQDLVIKPSREIAAFVILSQNSLDDLLPDEPQAIHLAILIPLGSKRGTYDGNIEVRRHEVESSANHEDSSKRDETTEKKDSSKDGVDDRDDDALLRRIKIKLGIVGQGVILNIPNGFQLNSHISNLGGPISLANFGARSSQGGFVPDGGAKIDITSLPLPTPPLDDFIYHELKGATITSVSSISASGANCTAEFYTDSFGPLTMYTNVALYCPSAPKLYKIYLLYRTGDAMGPQFLDAFQQVLNTIQFIP